MAPFSLRPRWRPLLFCLLLPLLAGCNLTPPAEGSPAEPEPAPSATSAIAAPTKVAEVARPAAATATVAATVEATAEVPATPRAEPTATVPPETTPDPGPRLVQLTSGGCCTQPFWSGDSSEVRFIDRPGPAAPPGIWAVPRAAPGSAPTLVTEEIRSFNREGDFLVETGEGLTVIERLTDGTRWEIDTQGDSPAISPDGQRIAWDVRDRSLPFDQQVAEIWVAAIDGSGATRVLTLPRGSVRDWLTNDRLLLNGRDSLDGEEQRIFTLDVEDGTTTDLVRSDRLRGDLLSPGGNWLAYYIAQSSTPADNGLWIAPTGGGPARQLPAGLFGAYQWRDDDRLLVVPLVPDAPFHDLWEVEAATGEARALTDPTTLPFKIANGEWFVSPDGSAVLFVESRDDNLWLIELE